MNKQSHEHLHKRWTFYKLNNNLNIWKEFIILRAAIVVSKYLNNDNSFTMQITERLYIDIYLQTQGIFAFKASR